MGILDNDLDHHLRNASRRHVMRALAGGTALAGMGPWASAFGAPAPGGGMQTAPQLGVSERTEMDPDDPAPDDAPDAVQGDTLEWLASVNPDAAAVVSDVIARAKLSFTAAAAGLDTGADAVGGASRRFLAGRPVARRAAFSRAAQGLLAAPPAVRQRHFGRYANLPPEEATTLSRAAVSQRLGGSPYRRGSISRPILEKTFGAMQMSEEPDFSDIKIPPNDPQAEAKKKAAEAEATNIALGKKYKHIEFFIRRVECFEGTGDPGGHDEIALAGYVIGATGIIKHVSPFDISENFIPKSEGGQTNHGGTEISARDYGVRGRHFAWLELNQSAPWPHDYQAGVTMGELDWGGFAGFVDDLWGVIGVAVADALGDAAAEGLGALAGSAIPIPGLGTLIGLTIGAIINFIIQAVKDDVVGSIHTKLTLNHRTFNYYRYKFPGGVHPNWHGRLASQGGVTYNREFKDSGRYKVKMGWRVMSDEGFENRKKSIAAVGY